MILLLLAGMATHAAPPPSRTIAVPDRDIPPGGVISEEVLKVRPAPTSLVPGGANHLHHAGQLVGRTAAEWLLRGEPVDPERLTDVERGFGMQALVEDGMRAVTLDVESTLGVEVGAMVRVVEAIPQGEEHDSEVSVWVAPVLAVDDSDRTVMLMVAPATAQHLSRPLPRLLAVTNPIDVTGVVQHGPVEISAADQAATSVVARRDLVPGIRIDRSDVVTVSDAAGLPLEWVVGRIPRYRILAGEAVREERLADPEGGRGLFAVVPRGMLGVPVRVDRTQALQAGNYVDLVLFDATAHTTITFAQVVFLLDVGPEDLMLLLTHDQAADLRHATARGAQPSVVLRNDLDVETVDLAPETWAVPPTLDDDATRRHRRRGK